MHCRSWGVSWGCSIVLSLLFRAHTLYACSLHDQSPNSRSSPSSPIQVTALTENRYPVRHVRGAGHVQLLCQCLASALVLQTVDLIFPILLVKGGGGAPSVGVLAQRHGPCRVFDSIAVEAAKANLENQPQSYFED